MLISGVFIRARRGIRKIPRACHGERAYGPITGAGKRSLSAARSITYPDPAGGGATGILVAHIFERLGLTADMKPKTKFPPQGQFGAEVVARGDDELAISQPMEVLTQPGTELAGLLPAELQDPPNFTFSMSVMSAAKERQAGQALIEFLSGPAAASVLKPKAWSLGRAARQFAE